MSDKIIKPSILSGFMELLPDEQRVFDDMKRVLEEVFASYGFYGLDTPVLERSSVLLAKGGGETEKQVYRFDRGDTDITMRYDLTVPLARYVAMHYSDLSFPFKRYQIGKVYRGERSQKGRFREFYQCDIDIIGDGTLGIINEAECPSVMSSALRALGIEDFCIRLNNRKILNGLFEIYGVGERSMEVMREIDKYEKIGRDNVIAGIKELGVSEENANALLDFVTFNGNDAEVFAKLDTLAGKNEILDTGVSDLKQVTEIMKGFGCQEKNFKVDLSIARGLDYYTGTVFETCFLPDPSIGSICSGGRYDDLAGYFIDRPLPGVGMSIGLTRLFYILSEKNLLNKSFSAPADALVLPMTDDIAGAAKIASDLRNEGISVQLYGEQKKFKKKMEYANKLGIPYVVIIGEDELKEGKVSLKDMVRGEQDMYAISEAAEIIRSGRSARNAGKCVISGN